MTIAIATYINEVFYAEPHDVRKWTAVCGIKTMIPDPRIVAPSPDETLQGAPSDTFALCQPMPDAEIQE